MTSQNLTATVTSLNFSTMTTAVLTSPVANPVVRYICASIMLAVSLVGLVGHSLMLVAVARTKHIGGALQQGAHRGGDIGDGGARALLVNACIIGLIGCIFILPLYAVNIIGGRLMFPTTMCQAVAVLNQLLSLSQLSSTGAIAVHQCVTLVSRGRQRYTRLQTRIILAGSWVIPAVIAATTSPYVGFNKILLSCIFSPRSERPPWVTVVLVTIPVLVTMVVTGICYTLVFFTVVGAVKLGRARVGVAPEPGGVVRESDDAVVVFTVHVQTPSSSSSTTSPLPSGVIPEGYVETGAVVGSSCQTVEEKVWPANQRSFGCKANETDPSEAIGDGQKQQQNFKTSTKNIVSNDIAAVGSADDFKADYATALPLNQKGYCNPNKPKNIKNKPENAELQTHRESEQRQQQQPEHEKRYKKPQMEKPNRQKPQQQQQREKRQNQPTQPKQLLEQVKLPTGRQQQRRCSIKQLIATHDNGVSCITTATENRSAMTVVIPASVTTAARRESSHRNDSNCCSFCIDQRKAELAVKLLVNWVMSGLLWMPLAALYMSSVSTSAELWLVCSMAGRLFFGIGWMIHGLWNKRLRIAICKLIKCK